MIFTLTSCKAFEKPTDRQVAKGLNWSVIARRDESKVFSQDRQNYAQRQVNKSIASLVRRDHHIGMRRSVLFALLTISLMLGVPAQGQGRGGGGSHGGGGGAHFAGGGSHFNGGRGFSNGSFRGRWGYGYGPYGGYGSFWGAGYYPDWSGWDWGWDLGPDYYAQPPEQPPSPPVIVMQSRDDNRQPAPPPQSPKLIELPDAKGGETAENLGPTVFVFTNGEKLESSRYVLTPESLRVDIGRQQRTIPLSDLNLDATVAANRQRGIDLKVPTDRSQIFLGF